MGATARKLDDHRSKPRTSQTKKRGTVRAQPKSTVELTVVRGKIHIDLKWTSGCMKELQRKCYYLRMAHNWTQAELAEKSEVCTATITRFEAEEQPLLEPRLRTFLQIFRKGFGAKLTVEVEE